MTSEQDRQVPAWLRPSMLLALASLAIHLVANGHYGFFRDELYFIVCGQHPAWGYVDQPPLVPLIAATSHAVFGDFLLGFRLVPMLVMTATVSLTAEFTRLLGGGRFAQALAGLCALGAPMLLVDGLLVFTDMFQALTWLGLSWCIMMRSRSGDQRWWLAFGAIAGFALWSKYSVAFYAAALIPGLLLTPLRRDLLKPWVWLGAALAVVMILPNLLWQVTHDWPFLALGQAAMTYKNLAMSPLDFFVQQLLLIGPLAALVWLAGLGVLAFKPVSPAARAFPIAWLLLFAFFVYSHGKGYYLTPIYPTLLGFGAVAIEGWLRAMAWRRTALVAVALCGLAMAPMAIPLLPVDTYIAYAHATGLSKANIASERAKLDALPQQFADMFGWPQMAAKVAAVYWALPPADRARAVFFGHNYGEAAAIDVFGARLGLPPAISGHNNYFLWGPRGHDGSVIILVGGNRAEMAGETDSIVQAGFIDAPHAMPYETQQPIYVLRGLHPPLAQRWPALKHYE